MKKFFIISALFFAAALMISQPVVAEGVTVGGKAPDFTGTDSNGKQQKLSSYKGKTVVLEWKNHECPFVKKHYGSGNMQNLQKEAVDKGVVWLSVISSAEGKQGHVFGKEANEIVKKEGSHASAVILDAKGEIGRLYGAKTTPHIFVIDKNGVVQYQGAIDDKPGTDKADIKIAKNYVRDAVNAVLKGENPSVQNTKPYGCGVKY